MGRGKGFRGLSDNCSQEPTFERLFLPKIGAFCLEFSGQGRKSGSAYALVDLVTLAPLNIIIQEKICGFCIFSELGEV